MRLGGPLFEEYCDPGEWVAALRRLGYSAAYCPVDGSEDDATISAYVEAASAAGIVIAEVGAWSNPISPDEATRRQAIALCQERLALADRVGARCCVNIAGSRGAQWDGPDPANLSEETFDLIVETVREIIDAVRPTRTCYTLELMPWVWPDSADSYLCLIEAVDRPRFGAHLDPVNWISSPQRYYANGALIRESIAKLGPHIRSCHAKDTLLSGKLTTHLSEVRPGLGALDYRAYLQALSGLDPDMPLMLEHLTMAEDYVAAVAYVRSVADAEGLSFR